MGWDFRLLVLKWEPEICCLLCEGTGEGVEGSQRLPFDFRFISGFCRRYCLNHDSKDQRIKGFAGEYGVKI